MRINRAVLLAALVLSSAAQAQDVINPNYGANPSATIGAAAVNGTALTFMRSDAAPALPATLPAVSGANLTNLNASALASGTVPCAQEPARTGDVTNSAGSCATTLASIPAISGANLTSVNAATLNGATMASPGTIGTTTPGAAAFAGTLTAGANRVTLDFASGAGRIVALGPDNSTNGNIDIVGAAANTAGFTHLLQINGTSGAMTIQTPGASGAGSKALCLNGNVITVSATSVCPP